MPADYRQSLGFLNLQLRAQNVARQQAEQDKIEQFDRESQQQDFSNALNVVKTREAAFSGAESRKLQLAAMMQKAEEDRAARLHLGDQSNATKIRGQDLTNEDRDTLRGINSADKDRNFQLKGGEFTYKKAHDADVLRQQAQIATTNASTKMDPVYGGPVVTVDPNAMLPGVRPQPPEDPSLGPRATKKVVEEAQKSLGTTEDTIVDFDEAIGALRTAKKHKEWFGPVAAGRDFDLPVFGKTNVGINSLRDLFERGRANPEDKANLQERQAYGRKVGKLLAKQVHDFSGAQAAEPEFKRHLAVLLGFDDKNVFANDPDALEAALQDGKAILDKQRERQQKITTTRHLPKSDAPKATNSPKSAGAPLSDDDIISALGDF